MIRFALRRAARVGARRSIERPRIAQSLCRAYSAQSTGETDVPKGTPYSDLTIGVPKETFPREKRVAATPETVSKLINPGFHVLIESNAGSGSHFSDADYKEAGATTVSKEELFQKSDIVMKVRPPTTEEAKAVGDKTLISHIYPAQNKELVQQLQDQNA